MSRNSFLNRMSAGVESYRGLGIGMEEAEAEAMVAEAEIEGAEITEDLAAANRAVEVSDGLEDIAAIAEQTIGDNDATESEAALINAAANMAVAGTDDNAEELVPAVESRQRVGVESIRQRAADIWRSIVEYIKKIWAKMESWIYKLFGNAPKLRRRVESLRKRAEGASTLTNKEKTMTVSSGLRALTLGGKVIKSGSELAKGLDHAETVSKQVLVDLQGHVKTFGDNLASAYEGFDVDKSGEFVDRMLTATSMKTMAGWGKDDAKRWDVNEFETLRSPELLGNRCVLIRVPNDKEAGKFLSVLGALDSLRRTSYTMGSYTNKDVTLPSEASMAPLSLGEIEAVCKSVSAFANRIEEYSRGKIFKDLKSVKDKIEKSAGKVASEWDRKVNELDGDGKKVISDENSAIMKSALSLNLTFLNLVKEPGASMIGYLVGVSYAAIALCDKSLSLYK